MSRKWCLQAIVALALAVAIGGPASAQGVINSPVDAADKPSIKKPAMGSGGAQPGSGGAENKPPMGSNGGQPGSGVAKKGKRKCLDIEERLGLTKDCDRSSGSIDTGSSRNNPSVEKGSIKTCKLDGVETAWTDKMTHVGNATENLEKVIDGLKEGLVEEDAATSTWPGGNYKSDNFGGDAKSAHANRLDALKKFENAKTVLDKLVRRVAGAANEDCRKCFQLSNWKLLRTAAKFVHDSHFLKESWRVGAGSIPKDKRPIDTIVKAWYPKSRGNIYKVTDAYTEHYKDQIKLDEIKFGTMSCIASKSLKATRAAMDKKTRKEREAAKNKSGVADTDAEKGPVVKPLLILAQYLCDGMTAEKSGKTKKRIKAIENLQFMMNKLVDFKSECPTEAKTTELMKSLKDKMTCENQAKSGRDDDFFKPKGDYATEAEVCAWAGVLDKLEHNY